MFPTLDILNDLKLVAPEVILVVAMCAAILVPFINRRNVTLPTMVAIIGLGAALIAAIFTTGQQSSSLVFSDMLAIDSFSQFFKIILMLFTLLVVMQWVLTSRDQTHAYDVPDFLCLLLGATVGMSLMASANNLLMILVATEAASLPSFVLAGFRKRTAAGSESSLKYVVFGAAASSVSIYGMSLVYGAVGSLDLAAVAEAGRDMSPMLAVGLMAMLAGFAFKLSAVPLHFWCPDVFEAAPTEVTTFLSVASKGAAICMLTRLLVNFGVTDGSFPALVTGVGILGAVTATWGNLAALQQSNIKRMLAYSSIAHAGYMIMGVSAAAMGGLNDEAIRVVAGAVLFYILVYTFMNLGAFTVAAVIARRTGSENLEDYAGLSSRSPGLAALLVVFMLSLFGMPGLGGFLGKIMIGAAMWQAGSGGVALIAVLVLNTLISFYYYVRPVYFMYLRPDTQGRPAVTIGPAITAMLVLCAVALVATGISRPDMTHVTKEYGRLVRSATFRDATTSTAATTMEAGERLVELP